MSSSDWAYLVWDEQGNLLKEECICGESIHVQMRKHYLEIYKDDGFLGYMTDGEICLYQTDYIWMRPLPNSMCGGSFFVFRCQDKIRIGCGAYGRWNDTDTPSVGKDVVAYIQEYLKTNRFSGSGFPILSEVPVLKHG